MRYLVDTSVLARARQQTIGERLEEFVMLHYDDDYDRFASVTGQPTEWVAPAGSLDR